MNYLKFRLGLFLIIFLIVISLFSNAEAATYYVSSSSGSDSNNGTSTSTPWKSLSKVNYNTFSAGDKILFKKGDSWFGQILPKSGSARTAIGVYTMGDSLTTGGYPALLQTSLGSNYTIVNKGVGGDETSQMLARFATDVTSYGNNDYVLIMGGTNDSWNGTPLYYPRPIEDVKANLQSMYDAAHNDGAKVVAMTIPPYGASTVQQAFIDELNTWIKSKPTNVDYVVDVYGAMDDPSNPGHLRAVDTTDNVHLTASGNQRLVDAVIASVDFFTKDNPNSITYGVYGTGEKPLIHDAIIMNSTSDWVEESANVWKSADAVVTGSELFLNGTATNNYSGVVSTFSSPATGSGVVDSVEQYNSASTYKLTSTNVGNAYGQIKVSANNTYSVEDGKSYQFSFYAKASANTNVRIEYYTSGGANAAESSWTSKTITTGWVQYTAKLRSNYTGNISINIYAGNTLLAGNSIWFSGFSVKEINLKTSNLPISNIIFNNATAGVIKWTKGTLASQGQFYWDKTNYRLYVYSVGNPSTYYSDIKALEDVTIFNVGGKSNIIIDGLAMKYTSGYIVSGSGSNNITIRNIDVSWVGGSETTAPGRKGNAIEFWTNTHDNIVENSTFDNVYDAALTAQGDASTINVYNIVFRKNLIKRSEYSYEFFQYASSSLTARNIFFDNNTAIDAGGGWGHSQRPDGANGRHVIIWNVTGGTPTNFFIRNNIFKNATESAIRMDTTTTGYLNMNHNDFYVNKMAMIYWSDYTTLAQWRTLSGKDLNSINSDPLFLSSSDYNLQSGSPAIDAGYKNGTIYNGLSPDMGAYESSYVVSDSTAPTITAFTVPATASSLTVSISSLTATDATGVTGYLVNESSTTPSAGDSGWSASAPTSYTFSSTGSKTLYAWAKDAAGNISTSASDTITITISSGGGGGGGGGSSSGSSSSSSIVTTTTTPTTTTITPTNTTISQSYIFTLPMKLGSKGAEVLQLQKTLNSLGYDCGTPDGSFGKKTQAAVIGLQKANKTLADGIVGPGTRAILNNQKTTAPTITTTVTPTVTTTTTTSGTGTTKIVLLKYCRYLSPGNDPSEVKKLQQILINKGYLTGTADGIFGKQTLNSVMKFQKDNGLKADGVVGEVTLILLNK